MEPIYIKVHSFVDLITNSSSEVFITVTDKTLELFKNIVDDLIKLQDPNSTLTCKDLFLVEEVYTKGTYLPYFKKQKDGKYKFTGDWDEYDEDIPVNSEFGKLIAEEASDRPFETSVRIFPKGDLDKNGEMMRAIADKISRLVDSVTAQEYYD